jgi:hypothetical protein
MTTPEVGSEWRRCRGRESNPDDPEGQGILRRRERGDEQRTWPNPDGHLIRRNTADPGPLPDGFQLHTPKVKGRVAGNVLEVCIGAQQFCPDVETRLGDDTVHSPTHGNPLATQRTV